MLNVILRIWIAAAAVVFFRKWNGERGGKDGEESNQLVKFI